jgi:hypothetical protein
MPPPSLGVDHVLRVLAENPPRITELTAGLTRAQLHAAPGPEEWSANDVLAHLRCCADVWGRGIRTMIDEDKPTIRAVSPRGWIKRTNYRDLTFTSSLQAFVAQRADLLAVLEPLPAKGWSRTATVRAAGKAQTWTLLSYVERLANHEHHHLDQFARIANAVRRDT